MASEWTITTLKELFDRTIADRDVRVNLALSAAKEAVTKAEAADEKRFALLNEFRAQQADESRKYVPREMVDTIFNGLRDRIGRNEAEVARLQGRALALAGFGALFGGAIGAVIGRMTH
jgi:anti-sigma factor RsiW